MTLRVSSRDNWVKNLRAERTFSVQFELIVDTQSARALHKLAKANIISHG